jgi:ABC-type lipoprotein release transport system permease subunit
MDESNIKYIIDKMGLALSEGQPGKNDTKNIFINENIAKAFKVNIGDYIDPQKDSISGITEKYRVCGIFKGDNVTAFIPISEEKLQTNPQFNEEYMVVFKTGKMEETNLFLRELKDENIKIVGFDEKVRFVTDIFKNYNSLINLMIILTIGFLSVVLGNHSYVHYIHRRREFGILKAMGFSKNKLLLKVGTEITLTTCTAMLLGTALLLLMEILLIRFYMLNIGLAPLSFKLDLILKLIPIPLSISIFTFIPVSRMIDKIDAITIIERVG